MLSRIIWPEYLSEQVTRGIKGAVESKQIKRTCLQVVNKDTAMSQARHMLAQLKEASQVPVCISCNIASPEEGKRLIEEGADKIGISLDCAGEAIYARVKGGSFKKQLKLICHTAMLIPGRVSTHLIVGLGETEEEMIQVMAQMVNWGVTVGLFAFTPVKGTKDQDKVPPVLVHYRRVQAALFLLEKRLAGIDDFTFTNGVLTGFGLVQKVLIQHLSSGEAFQTTGCPDCNRPYYNEKPGGIIYNYPRPLTGAEIEEALAVLGLGRDDGCHEQKVAGN
jgi:biotin synthase